MVTIKDLLYNNSPEYQIAFDDGFDYAIKIIEEALDKIKKQRGKTTATYTATTDDLTEQ